MNSEHPGITEEIVPVFLADLDAPSKATTETYRRALRPFFAFAKEREMEHFTQEDIREYRQTLEARPLSAITIQTYMTSVRKLFEYLEKTNRHPNVARYVRNVQLNTNTPPKSFMMAAEVAQVLQSIPTSDEKGKRNKAMIHLAVTTGLLGIELSRARRKDIETQDGKTILKVRSKGKSDYTDFVLLPADVHASIMDYLACRTEHQEAALFARLYGEEPREAIKPREIRTEIKKCLENADIEDWEHKSVHTFRDTAALLALRQQENVADVRNFMRHANLESTIEYARQSELLENTCSQTVADIIQDEIRAMNPEEPPQNTKIHRLYPL